MKSCSSCTSSETWASHQHPGFWGYKALEKALAIETCLHIKSTGISTVKVGVHVTTLVEWGGGPWLFPSAQPMGFTGSSGSLAPGSLRSSQHTCKGKLQQSAPCLLSITSVKIKLRNSHGRVLKSTKCSITWGVKVMDPPTLKERPFPKDPRSWEKATGRGDSEASMATWKKNRPLCKQTKNRKPCWSQGFCHMLLIVKGLEVNKVSGTLKDKNYSSVKLCDMWCWRASESPGKALPATSLLNPLWRWMRQHCLVFILTQRWPEDGNRRGQYRESRTSGYGANSGTCYWSGLRQVT